MKKLTIMVMVFATIGSLYAQVGINNTDPQRKLDVNGKLLRGNLC